MTVIQATEREYNGTGVTDECHIHTAQYYHWEYGRLIDLRGLSDDDDDDDDEGRSR